MPEARTPLERDDGQQLCFRSQSIRSKRKTSVEDIHVWSRRAAAAREAVADNYQLRDALAIYEQLLRLEANCQIPGFEG